VTQDFVVVFQPDAEHGVGQQFDYLATHFEKFFFSQTMPREYAGAPRDGRP
jgi:hypothetical protein